MKEGEMMNSKCKCKIECDCDREFSIEYCEEHEKGLEALELWRKWFSEDGDPRTWYMEIDIVCFFCGESFDRKNPKHAVDCLWVRANDLITVEAAP